MTMQQRPIYFNFFDNLFDRVKLQTMITSYKCKGWLLSEKNVTHLCRQHIFFSSQIEHALCVRAI